MSIATLSSSSRIAAASSAPLGTLRTGLPAETNRARIRPSPGVVDLLRHQRRRHRAEHLRESADPRAAFAVVAGADQLGDPLEGDRRLPNIEPPGGVEVAGREREGVEEERDERPVATEARAGAPVDRGAVGGGDVAGERPDPLGIGAGRGRGRRRRERRDQLARGRRRRLAAGESAAVLETLVEDDLKQGEEQPASESGRIGRCSNSRAVSDRRGSTTTTRPPRPVIALSWSLIRGAHITRAVRDQRVGADDQQDSSVRSRSGIGSRNGEP